MVRSSIFVVNLAAVDDLAASALGFDANAAYSLAAMTYYVRSYNNSNALGEAFLYYKMKYNYSSTLYTVSGILLNEVSVSAKRDAGV